MDAIAQQQRRNSRWTREPIIGRDGIARAVHPTERDIEIFRCLARYRFLPADYIHAFVGGSAKALSHRLNLLSRKPNLYIARPHQQRQNAAANYRPLTYELDERGSRTLRERGHPFLPKSYHRNFAHELMVAQITASIELGTRETPSVRLITWPEILASGSLPPATRDSARPTTISVTYRYQGEACTSEINPDARPFGLERMIEGKRSYLFFPGIEADCGTEPIESHDGARASIAKKFAAYLAITAQGQHRTHFGFPNFFVPFITVTAARQQSMMNLVSRLTGGQGSKTLLFKTFPAFTSPDRPPAPGGHMLTAPWHRVGHPPLCLDR